MPRLTITISDELDDELARRSETEAFDSKADAVRALIERGREADELRRQLDEREERIERLESELERKEGQIEALREARGDRVDTLVERAEKRHRDVLAPFFVRWIRWLKLRRRDGAAGSEDRELPTSDRADEPQP